MKKKKSMDVKETATGKPPPHEVGNKVTEAAKQLISQMEIAYTHPCRTCEALKVYVGEIQKLGYQQVTVATLRAILAAGEQDDPKDGTWQTTTYTHKP